MELPKTKVPESFCIYRGVTPSEDITRFVKDSALDIQTLFTILNQNKDEIENLKNISNIENLFLFNKNEQLNTRIEELYKQLEEAIGQERTLIVNAFNAVASTSNPCTISQEFNQLSIPIQGYTSKLYIYDSLMEKNITPPSLKVEVKQTPAESPDISVIDNNLNNMVDGDSITCWQRKVRVPKTMNLQEVTVDIHISLPHEIVSNRYINTISICPHPIQGVDILDIKYKYGESYKQIPGFSEHSLYLSENEEEGIFRARPIRLFFNSLEASEITISLRQRVKIEEGDYDVFYFGAYSVDAGYTTFTKDNGEFNATLTLSGNTNTINEVTAIVDNKSLCGPALQYEIYAINEVGSPVFLSDKLPVTIDGKKLMIKGKIIKTTEVAPSIAKVELKYEAS